MGTRQPVVLASATVILAALTFVVTFVFPIPPSDVLAAIGLYVVLFVAVFQQFHLGTLARISRQTVQTGTETKEIAARSQDIAEQTRKIASSIHMDVLLEQNIHDFFGVSEGDGKVYECAFPIDFGTRPMPYIHAGDYRVLHVLINLLGSDRIELSPFLRGKDAKTTKDNVIFVCAPDANPITKTKFDGENMPCWIEDSVGGKRLRIGLGDDVKSTTSACEADYIEAQTASEQDRYTRYTDKAEYQDYGILARKKSEKGYFVLIAGIHQPGTWIVADFLSELLKSDRKENHSVFFGEEDFAAVIMGAFQPRAFKSKGTVDHWWWRTTNGWEKGP